MKSSITTQPDLPVWRTRAAGLALIPVLAVLCLAAAAKPESGPRHDDDNPPTLVGSWVVKPTLHIPGVPPFEIPASLVSHAAGGVTIISDPGQLAPPPAGAPTTPFHGAWTRKGGRHFAFRAELRQFVEGALLEGRLKEAVQMTGRDAYEGEGTIEIVHPDGTKEAYGVTTVATRIKTE